MRFKLIGLILISLLFIGNASATSGLSVSPGLLTESGAVKVTNMGDKTLIISSSIIQVMIKDGNQILQPTNKPAPSETFILPAGASKTVHITVPGNDGMLYGVKFEGKEPIAGQITTNVAVVAKVVGGLPTNIIENFQVKTDVFPIYLSGLDIPIKYTFQNLGNVPMEFHGKTYFPNDNGSIVEYQNIGLLEFGFKDVAGKSVFVIQSPLVILGLLVGVFFYLRRKVSIQLK